MLTPCNFQFDDTPVYPGFTDGTCWNGWNNVWVTPETHAAIVAFLDKEYDIVNDDEFRALPPGDDGLVSYAYGYTPAIVDDTNEA